MAGQVDTLKQAGFSDQEIGDWSSQQRQTLAQAGFSNNEIDGYFTGVTVPDTPPQPFLDRFMDTPPMRQAKGLLDTGAAAAKGFGEAFSAGGPLGLSPEDETKLSDAGIFRDPKTGRGGPLRFMNEALVRPAATLADAFTRLPSAVVGAAVGAAGEIGKEAGQEPNDTERMKRELELFGNFAMQVGGAEVPAEMSISRPGVGALGHVRDEPIGGVPHGETFNTAAKAVAGPTAPDHVSQKMLTLYTDHGFHPAEVAHDAASDATVTQSLLSDGPDLPYGVKPAEPVAAPEPEAAFAPPPRQSLDEAIDAYHGSPHEFLQFQSDRIGSGEGAQAYGHGLYVAEKEGIAKHYRDTLSRVNRDEDFKLDGKSYHGDELDDVDDAEPDARLAILALMDSDFNVAEVRKQLERESIQPPTWAAHALEPDNIAAELRRVARFDPSGAEAVINSETIVAEQKKIEERIQEEMDANARSLKWLDENHQRVTAPDKKEGQLYQVKIPRHVDHFIDLDAPFSEQSEYVKNALENPPDGSMRGIATVAKESKGPIIGALKSYGFDHSGDEASGISKGLSDLGIAGYRYLDRNSRKEGEGSRNYVVINDKDILITHRNDEPILDHALREAGLDPKSVSGEVRDRTLDIMVRDRITHPLDAYKKAVEELTNEEIARQKSQAEAGGNDGGRPPPGGGSVGQVVPAGSGFPQPPTGGDLTTDSTKLAAGGGGGSGGDGGEGSGPSGAGGGELPGPAGPVRDAKQAILDRLSIGEGDASKGITLDKIYTYIVDKLFPISKATDKSLPASENPYQLARLYSGIAGKVEHMLDHGTFDFNTYENNGPGLKEILSPVKGDLDGFRAFATSVRAAELEKRGIETGVPMDAARDVVLNPENQAKYAPVLKRLIDFQDNIAKYLRDAGVLSAEGYDAMKEANRFYVPFNRVMGDGVGGGRGVGASLQARNPIHAIEGSERKIVDPIENVIRNAYLLTAMAEKNAIGTKLIDMLLGAAKDTDAKPGTELTAPKTDAAQHQQIAEFMKNEGIAAPDDLVDAMQSEAQGDAKGTITVFRDGKRETYKVDPDLASAFKGLDAPSVGLIEKILAVPSNLLRAGAVLTPDFALRHMLRDYDYAFITNKGKTPFTPIDMARGLAGLITHDADYQAWLKGGGANVSMVSMDRRYLQANLEKLTEQTGLMRRAWNVVGDPDASILQKVGAVAKLPGQVVNKFALSPLRMLTELAEGASHLGAFKKAMRESEDASKAGIQQAAWTSRDTAVDAARSGASMRAYNMITAFANITVQDSDRIARAFINNPTATALKVAAGITLPSAILWAVNHNDPRYQEIPQWQKDTFWIIMTPNHIFRIPKPFGAGVLFGSTTERALDAFATQKPDAFKHLFESIKDTMVPQFYPTIAAPIIEQFANRSTFTNRTLIPDQLEKQLPEYQYTPYTSETAKALGRIVGAFPGMEKTAVEPGTAFGGVARALSSPILMENYLRGWTGNLGMYALAVTDKGLRASGTLPDPPQPAGTLADIPVVKAFAVRYPTATAQSIQDFQDAYAENKTFYTTWQAQAKNGDANAMRRIQAAGGPRMFVQLDTINKTISEQNQIIRNVWKDPKMDPDQKRQLIDTIYYREIEIAHAGLAALRNIKETRH